MALSGDGSWLAVGSPVASGGELLRGIGHLGRISGVRTGVVELLRFSEGAWSEFAALTPTNAPSPLPPGTLSRGIISLRHGHAVSISGDGAAAVVGMPFESGEPPDTLGSAPLTEQDHTLRQSGAAFAY